MARTSAALRVKDTETIPETSWTAGEAIRTTLLNRVSWGAVMAGVAVAFTIQLVLTLFGLGVGFATLDSYTGTGVSAEEFSWGAAIWWIIAGVLGAFAGGFTAGRLAGEPKESTAGWHGFVSWATCTLVIAILMTSAAAGTVATMSGPFQIIMDREAVSFAPETPAMTTEPTFMDTEITQAQATTDVDADLIATAALVSAIALLVGAAAAWFGGCAGTIDARAGLTRNNNRTTTLSKR